jgi:hypothetical protein
MKKQYFNLILNVAIALLLSQNATAQVDPLEGSFKTEIEFKKTKILYNSRSLDKSSLGIGWQQQNSNQKLPPHSIKNGLLIQYGPYKMVYNQFKNLVSIRKLNQLTVIKYDDTNDTVIEIKTRNCLKKYKYSHLESATTYTQVTEKSSNCRDSAIYKFVFLKTARGLKQLRQGSLP